MISGWVDAVLLWLRPEYRDLPVLFVWWLAVDERWSDFLGDEPRAASMILVNVVALDPRVPIDRLSILNCSDSGRSECALSTGVVAD